MMRFSSKAASASIWQNQRPIAHAILVGSIRLLASTAQGTAQADPTWEQDKKRVRITNGVENPTKLCK